MLRPLIGQMSSREPDSPHVSSSKVRVTEVRFREVGVLEVRAAQIRLLEYGTGCLTAPEYHDAPWLDCTRYEQAMRRSHDIFNAVIAALTARAAARAQTIPPTRDDRIAAAAAGWIVVPDKPISALL